MDDPVGGLLKGQQAFGTMVHTITADEWTLPTPNPGWTVTDLVAHMIYWQRWMPPLLQGLGPDEAAKVVDAVRERPAGSSTCSQYAAAWDEAAAASAEAYREDGALDRVISLVRGPTDSADFLQEMIFELVVHSWDLARAIGQEPELPRDVVEQVWEQYREYADLSAMGVFDSPFDVSGDASTLAKLVAMTGRDPR